MIDIEERKRDLQNFIHPTAIVHPKVKMGKGNWIGPYCTIYEGVSIGDNNKFCSYVSIGSPAEHKEDKFNWLKNPQTGKVEIGNDNTFREFITINKPIVENGLTKIEDNCYIMRGSHISHDSYVESNVIMSCDVILGGHTRVMKGAYMGIKSATHPYKIIGSYSIAGMGAVITKDFGPGLKIVGTPAKDIGLNEVGLKRANLNPRELSLEVDRFIQLLEERDA